jgi:hypothetical protein
MRLLAHGYLGSGRGLHALSLGSPSSSGGLNARLAAVAERFKVGDKVSWNSEAGRVSGVIVRIHREDFAHKGYTHHASRDDPQYEIKSSKTDHIAMHKGSALSKLSN